ncbi:MULTISPECIES: baseplate J/gp47 family protein [Clostridium]|uniref:Baseplate J family protein n=1 Tax=Clostridium novyi B str. ATCC 27606 TaxID=1443123 RepID=A0AA40IRK3_CLONO|nr:MULTISPECIES: baseplate J/gp47 family protein [Clostridium]KEI08177.1 baseplate J family protein [Clostridium novyi B str. NCTC 9691]KEI11445.1 baseplate J family protein [Clostridium novyi B str. ATCC 27606]KLU74285.1 phage-like element PBSX protein xkdT [Clostridium botulinum V891]
MEKDFNIPDFLQEDADTIHERMLKKAPPNVSTIPGDFFWDNTRPTAEEKAELVQLKLQNILRLAFPQTSYGVWLEYLGECKGVFKNPATYSTGVIKIKGKPGTIIEKGKVVGTTASDKKESIEFEFTETKTIEESGLTTIKAKCLVPGTIGNVLKGNINILFSSINGVESITNEDDFYGGTDIEDEESFRERVVAADKEEELSGADTDYIRWAKQVPGVGYAYVDAEWNGPGTTKVLILDKNGKTANKELIDKVQKYIAPIVPKGQNRGGKAPVGATVTISTPNILTINISASLKFDKSFNSQNVLNDLRNKIDKYLSGIKLGGTIIYKAIDTIIGSLILSHEGLLDFKNLTINNDTHNIVLKEEVAILGEVKNIDNIS